ncbi:MAG: TspO/MBR family protein [Sphingomonadales bacterium]
MSRVLQLGLFLALVVGGGSTIGVLTGPGDWYAALAKPAFNPPDWVFAPVWTLLYVMIAVVGWRLWRGDRRSRAMHLWWLQLALNFLWSPVFFSLHWLEAAMGVILLLLAGILGCIATAWRRDRVAAWLMVPYAAWVAFASVLNAALAVLN